MNDEKESSGLGQDNVYDFNQEGGDVSERNHRGLPHRNYMLGRKDLEEDFPDVRDRAKDRLDELGIIPPEISGDGLDKHNDTDSSEGMGDVIDASNRFGSTEPEQK